MTGMLRSMWLAATATMGILGAAMPLDAQQGHQRLRQRFMDVATEQLDLSERQRAEVGRIFDGTMERRMELVRDQTELQRRIMAALRDPATQDADFRRLVERITELKRREVELLEWQQSQLSRVLEPRQTLRFLLLQQRVAERIQRARQGPSQRR
jgi:Spy/CpxP family protein refolding chaperone